MKRWRGRMALCLVLGITTTIGVAWACAKFSHPPRVFYTPAPQSQWAANDAASPLVAPDTADRSWLDDIHDGPTLFRYRHTTETTGRKVIEYHVDSASVHRRYGFAIVRAGWPMHALRSRPCYASDAYSAWFLPVPIPGGFAVDVVAHAAGWFLLLFGYSGFVASRRALRKKRGRCPKCAYQLRGQLDAGCSECGWGRE